MPDDIKLYEVGPRDGLQNEQETVPTDVKVELIERLGDAGLSYVESTSFVSPKWVPQMADASDVMDRIARRDGVTYPVLVPNRKGMERALEAEVSEVAVFAAATETFSQKNLNCSIEESFERFEPVFEIAEDHDVSVRGYVSCVAGCPYEGEVEPESVAKVAAHLSDMGCYEISLGDTIGVGTPEDIKQVLSAVTDHVPIHQLALHCHDTYGQALANIYAGLQEGITVIDSSVGGLGGCPYTKNPTGNVATEEVLYMLDQMNYSTGVDLKKIVDIAWFITGELDCTPTSRVARVMRNGSASDPRSNE